MSPEEIHNLASILSKFYVWEILIIGVAILLTTFLKLPIKKKAVELQNKYGVDKSMLTWITALIPYVLCLIMTFVLYWYKSNWSAKLETLDYAAIITEALMLGSGAIGIYEAVKKIIQGSKAINEKKALKKEAVASASAQSESKFRIRKDK